MIDINIKDEWGGIDEMMKPLVAELNRLNFPTTGSCEGHVSRGYPGPWVSIRLAEESPKKNSEEMSERMSALINEFYKDPATDSRFRISILPGHGGFWIYLGGDKFIKFREDINAYAEKKANGENPKTIEISAEEKAEREKNLPKFHKEIIDFVEFLKNRNS